MVRIARCEVVQVSVMRETDVTTVRKFVKRSVFPGMDDGFEFVIASYNRAVLKQMGSGHFSPIAA